MEMHVLLIVRVLLIFLLFTTTCFSQQNRILVVGNYNSICLEDSLFTFTDSLPHSLDSVQILMLFSSSTSNLNHHDIDKIEDFVRNGGGLYSGSDNWPLQAQSNQVTNQIYRKENFGNYKQENAKLSEDGNLKLKETITIPAGKTTTAFPMDYRLKVEAWVDDQPLISSGILGKGKIIIDGGYSRFYCVNRSESTDFLLQSFLQFLYSK